MIAPMDWRGNRLALMELGHSNRRGLQHPRPRQPLMRGEMARLVCAGIIGSWVVFVFTSMLCAQTEKEAGSKRESQTEGVADRAPYVIGPGDVLTIEVWKEDALSKTLPVRTDGNISLPLVHEIKAAGLTPLQLEAAIAERLKGFYDNPDVSITVMEINSFKVYVSGEVKTPGVYKLRQEVTLLQIIPMAGGFTEWAKPNKVLIIRKENGREKRFTVDYEKAAEGDGPNVVLKPGDTIIVEKSRLKKHPVPR